MSVSWRQLKSDASCERFGFDGSTESLEYVIFDAGADSGKVGIVW